MKNTPVSKDDALAPAFDIVGGGQALVPLVFSSPHSGSRYSGRFLKMTQLDPLTLRRSEDAFVDQLFMPCLSLGAPMLRAHFPRAWLDVNREPYELDPVMFSGHLPPFANTRSLRVAGGLGTVPRIVADRREIYAAPLPVSEALERIETLWKPWHQALRGLIEQGQSQFGTIILIDCHSMPSVFSAETGENGGPRADIVIGDRFGTSCAPWIAQNAEQSLRQAGYKVQRNKPYAGGYITEHYGQPARQCHALQIEINRALYMNEATFEKTSGFDELAHDLKTCAQSLMAEYAHRNNGLSQAAE